MKKISKFLILAFSLAITSTIATAQNNAISDAKNSGDNYFEIAKNLDIFTTLYKELNTFYVDETNPEVNFDKIEKMRGLDITVVTSTKNKEASKALLDSFNFPFYKKGSN